MGEPARNLHQVAMGDVNTSPQAALTTELATFNQRFLAILIDGVAISVVRALLVAVATAVTHSSGKSIGISLLGGAVTSFYMIFMQFNDGQTLGKRVMKIRCESDTGVQLGFGQIVFRETIGRLLSALPLCLGYVGAARRPDRKTWYDRMAKTKVVKVS